MPLLLVSTTAAADFVNFRWFGKRVGFQILFQATNCHCGVVFFLYRIDLYPLYVLIRVTHFEKLKRCTSFLVTIINGARGLKMAFNQNGQIRCLK